MTNVAAGATIFVPAAIWGIETMNQPAIFRVASAARFAAVCVTFFAIGNCSHTPSAASTREQRADAEIPLVQDAGMSTRDAAVRDAATTPRTLVDAASRAPGADAQVDLCAGTVCVTPAHCETSGDFAHCACPAGMEFVDLGGDHAPCRAMPVASADDGGDAADGG